MRTLAGMALRVTWLHRRGVFLVLVATLVNLVGPAYAEENPVHAEVRDGTVAPGGTVPVEVTVVIPDGYHVYANVLGVEVKDAGQAKVGAPVYPPAYTRPDPLVAGKTREVYENDATVTVPVTVPQDAAGELALTLEASYQACKDTICFPTKIEDLTALLKIVPGIAGAGVAAAQSPDEEAAVRFSGVAGAPNTATIHVDLQGEWHINKMFVGFTLPTPGAHTLGEANLPPGEKTGSEADGTAREDYTKDIDWVVPVSGPPGATELEIEVAYQACKGVSLCRMPISEKVKVPVTIGDAGAATAAPVVAAEKPAAAAEKPARVDAAPAQKEDSAFAAAAKRGWGALLLFCFLAGVGVSFTPCVLPMVPITMGLIGARGAGSRFGAVSRAATYVLGQALVYTILGVVAGQAGALFGSQMQSAWVVGGIAAFFVVMAFGMFGAFDIQVPGFLQSRISGYEGRGDYAAAFVFGMIGAVLAGPCSGPVVAAILGVIAAQGQVMVGAALMFTFAVGMGMIFLVTGAATGWLPQRGPWMVFVKKSFGVVMLLGAIFYAKSLLTDVQTALATAGVLLGTAVFGWPHEEDGEGFMTVRLRQVYGIAAGAVALYLLVGTLITEGFILPPLRVGSTATAPTEKIGWLTSEAEGIAAATASGKPMMIDFTAEWCAACHELEKFTYTDGAVITESKEFVTVMIDCTDESDATIKAVQKKYGVTGLPTVVFAKPDGTVLNSTIGFLEAEPFLAEMKKARAADG